MEALSVSAQCKDVLKAFEVGTTFTGQDIADKIGMSTSSGPISGFLNRCSHAGYLDYAWNGERNVYRVLKPCDMRVINRRGKGSTSGRNINRPATIGSWKDRFLKLLVEVEQALAQSRELRDYTTMELISELSRRERAHKNGDNNG